MTSKSGNPRGASYQSEVVGGANDGWLDLSTKSWPLLVRPIKWLFVAIFVPTRLCLVTVTLLCAVASSAIIMLLCALFSCSCSVMCCRSRRPRLGEGQEANRTHAKPPMPVCFMLVASCLVRVYARLVLFFLGFYWISARTYPPAETSHTSQSAPAWKPREKPRTTMVVANHVGYVDILALAWLFGPAFIAKQGVRSFPGVGFVAQSMQCIFVDRSSSMQRNLAKVQLEERFKSNLLSRRPSRGCCVARYPVLAIFPEGTTTNGTVVLQFQKGSFQSLLAAVAAAKAANGPVENGSPTPLLEAACIQYVSFKVPPAAHFSPAWAEGGFLPHFLRLICQFYNRLTVVLHQPAELSASLASLNTAADAEIANSTALDQQPILLASAAQHAVARGAGIRVSKLSYRDSPHLSLLKRQPQGPRPGKARVHQQPGAAQHPHPPQSSRAWAESPT